VILTELIARIGRSKSRRLLVFRRVENGPREGTDLWLERVQDSLRTRERPVRKSCEQTCMVFSRCNERSRGGSRLRVALVGSSTKWLSTFPTPPATADTIVSSSTIFRSSHGPGSTSCRASSDGCRTWVTTRRSRLLVTMGPRIAQNESRRPRKGSITSVQAVYVDLPNDPNGPGTRRHRAVARLRRVN